jgi:hypothetical protein
MTCKPFVNVMPIMSSLLCRWPTHDQNVESSIRTYMYACHKCAAMHENMSIWHAHLGTLVWPFVFFLIRAPEYLVPYFRSVHICSGRSAILTAQLTHIYIYRYIYDDYPVYACSGWAFFRMIRRSAILAHDF